MFKKLFIKSLSLFLVFNFTFVSSLKAEVVFVTSFDASFQDSQSTGIGFNNDGTKMFVVGQGNRKISEYSLSTGFDLTTVTFVDDLSVAAQENAPQDISFNNDGTKMFIVGYTGKKIYEYTLSTGFDISSTVTFVDSFSVTSQETQPTSVAFNSDGTKMFVMGLNGDDVNEYSLSTGFDLTSTVTFVDMFWGGSLTALSATTGLYLAKKIQKLKTI